MDSACRTSMLPIPSSHLLWHMHWRKRLLQSPRIVTRASPCSAERCLAWEPSHSSKATLLYAVGRETRSCSATSVTVNISPAVSSCSCIGKYYVARSDDIDRLFISYSELAGTVRTGPAARAGFPRVLQSSSHSEIVASGQAEVPVRGRRE